ncbi:MAG: outer membrane protein assembly factor BamA [Bdellovibrionales bacterium]|nr:outer membrane protein assembly factor BamA [Bdellovibrionales bacterium]
MLIKFDFLLFFCIFASFSFAEDKLFAKNSMIKDRKIAQLKSKATGRWIGPVDRIVLQGNQVIDSKLIQLHLSDTYTKVKKRKSLTTGDIQTDVKHLFSLGFFDDIQVSLGRSKKKEKVLFYKFIERIYISSLEFKGNETLNDKELKEEISVKEYEFLDLYKLQQSFVSIKKKYEDQAYYLAEISYRLKKNSANKKAFKLIIDIKENRRLLIQKIQFIGNRNISAKSFKPFMQLQEKNLFSFLNFSGVYKKEYLERDLQVLEFYYRDQGYLNVKIHPPRISITPDQRNLFVTFEITEGIRFKMGEYFFKEKELSSQKDRLKLSQKEYFSLSALQQDIQFISNIYKNQGYAFVKVEPLFYPDSLEENKINLTFKISRGEKYKVRRIKITGNQNARDKIIFRRFQIKEGDIYNQNQIDLTQQLLEQLVVFEKVDISPSLLSSKKRELDLTTVVKERETIGEAGLALGYNSIQKLTIQGNFKKDNIFGLEESFALKISLSAYDETGFISYQNPYFLDSLWNFGFEVFHVGQQSYTGSGGFNLGQILTNTGYDTYFSMETGSSLTVGRKLGLFSTLFLKYKFSHQQSSDEPLYLVRGLPGFSSIFNVFKRESSDISDEQNLENLSKEDLFRYQFSDIYDFSIAKGYKSSLSIIWEKDKRNDRFYPTKGFFTRMTGEFVGLGGDFDYTKLTGNFKYYYNPFWKLVIKNRLDLGWVFSNVKDKPVPFTDLFLLGGPYNLRGFSVNSQGPKKESEKAKELARKYISQEGLKEEDKIDPEAFARRPYGGKQKLFYSLELEIPLIEQAGLRLATFFDIGEANDSLGFNLKDQLRANVGIGLRWLSPFGPLNLDLAKPYKPRKEYGEESWEIQFSFGSTF